MYMIPVKEDKTLYRVLKPDPEQPRFMFTKIVRTVVSLPTLSVWIKVIPKALNPILLKKSLR